ncbi:phage tail protein [Actinophytocola algeriensis]|uniref:Phage tail-like protein n=1 Tax=Actinophytocola algeriensis TaxID=1768010 RepID=A0A7W7VHM5_9PSEU|nr:phage tail protein [Actinophytocola algeriensis]MBB4910215.1 phage tail-like protein [Actinophytocola algeriensis]MBE1480796.1 phage tail-like protein [Actinophytocola algeriensis]
MGLTDTSSIGLANRFVVSMSGKSEYDLGSWTKAEGLDVAWDIAEYRMGDGGNDRLYFPGNTKYTNVKLIRGVSEETEKVKQWLNKNSWEMEVFAGSIQLYTTAAKKVTEWTLRDVMPAKWSITSFDAGASQVAMETLELVHRGFLEDERKLS